MAKQTQKKTNVPVSSSTSNVATATKEKKKRTSPEEFVTVWQKAENLDEVASRLNVGRGSVQVRASLMRKKGVKLKEMPRAKKINVDDLNKLIEGLTDSED